MPTPKSDKKPRVKKKSATKELTQQQEKFVNNIVKGENQTNAYQDAFPDSTRQAARTNAARLIAKDNIFDAVNKRKIQAAKNANITEAEVMGATAMIAFSSIEDAHDANGYFDYKKAVKTGAASLIKKISRTQTPHGENVSVEFYSKKDALDKLGEYLGMKQKERENAETLEKVVGAFQSWNEDNPQATSEQKAVWVQRFAKGSGVEARTLGLRVGVEIQEIGQIH